MQCNIVMCLMKCSLVWRSNKFNLVILILFACDVCNSMRFDPQMVLRQIHISSSSIIYGSCGSSSFNLALSLLNASSSLVCPSCLCLNTMITSCSIILYSSYRFQCISTQLTLPPLLSIFYYSSLFPTILGFKVSLISFLQGS